VEDPLHLRPAALSGNDHGFGHTNGRQLIQILDALDDHGTRRCTRWLLLEEPRPNDRHPPHEVEAGNANAKRHADKDQHQRQNQRRPEAATSFLPHHLFLPKVDPEKDSSRQQYPHLTWLPIEFPLDSNKSVTYNFHVFARHKESLR